MAKADALALLAIARRDLLAAQGMGDAAVVVMAAEEFQRLRDLELELALLETWADLAAGRVTTESVDDHLARLDPLATELP